MKRYCIIILLLCFYCMARGQTYGYSYWFDGDLSAKQTGTATTSALHIDADVSALAEGFHTLHTAVDDRQGNIVRVENAYFLKAQTEQLRVRCYVDGRLQSEQTVAAGNGGLRNINVDMTNVPTGLHQLCLMATTQGGTPVATYTTDFIRMATTAELGSLTARCYVDGLLQSVQAINATGGVQTINLDLLKYALGIHRLDVTLQTEGSAPVAAYSRFFIRNATTDELGGLVCTTYIDGVPYSQETINTGSGVYHLDLDVNHLTKGLHHLHMSAQTLNGRTTSIYNTFFLRMATTTELADMRLYYKFDSGQRGVLKGEKTEGGYHFAPDVSKLPAGLHHATFMFTDGTSTHGETRNVFFVKESATAASHYQYWVNGDTANIHTVPIQQWSDPTQITGMLTLPSYPLRPSRYHFEVQDGRPFAYAINDLTMRFYNEFQASVDTTTSYIDQTVGGEITQAIPLLPDSTITTPVPAADSIRWFTLTLDKESPIEVKTTSPATIQIYNPDGGRIHQVDGKTATDFSGPEGEQPTGNYWIAIHSADNVTVTGQGDTIAVNSLDVTAHYERAEEWRPDDPAEPEEPEEWHPDDPAEPDQPVEPIRYDRFIVNGIAYQATSQNNTDGWTVAVTSDVMYGGQLTIPATVVYDSIQWQVTSIADTAFANMDNLYSVSLPQSITKVGHAIFSNTEHLAAILWPMGITLSDSITADIAANPNMLFYVTDRHVTQSLPQWATNIIVNGVADSITLYDAWALNDFYCPEPFVANRISYTHHYGQTSGLGQAHGWESIALPFDVQDITHETQGELTPMARFDANDAAARPFWLAALGEEGWHEVEGIQANTPYIICMPNNAAYSPQYNLNGYVTFSAQDVIVQATNEGFNDGQRGDLLFTPCFQRNTNVAGIYTLNATSLYLPDGGDGDAFVRNHREAQPFEAYLVATGASGAKERIPIDFDGTANGIALVRPDSDGIWHVHDLTGRLLRQTTQRDRALSGLPTGIYIVNGQKVLVR